VRRGNARARIDSGAGQFRWACNNPESDTIEFKLEAVSIGSWLGPAKGYVRGWQGRWGMGTILIIIVVILLLGGGGGYYGYNRYGEPGSAAFSA
jgi:hypothetical protein